MTLLSGRMLIKPVRLTKAAIYVATKNTKTLYKEPFKEI